MSSRIPTPLPATPVTPTIMRHHNNRLGAIYLSLHAFWQSRQISLAGSGTTVPGQAAAPTRRDSYSVILFDHTVTRSFENDFKHTADNLLQNLLQYQAQGGTNYEVAVQETEVVMRKHWSTER